LIDVWVEFRYDNIVATDPSNGSYTVLNEHKLNIMFTYGCRRSNVFVQMQ